MAAVYSSRFIAVSANPPASQSAIVPAGVVWIVRGVSISMQGSDQVAVMLAIVGQAPFDYWEGNPPSDRAQYLTHQVLNPGDELAVSISGGPANVFVVISGYALNQSS